MNLFDLFKATMLSLGVHEMGHKVKADELGIPVALDRNGTIMIQQPTTTRREDLEMGASGFVAQDVFADATQDQKMKWVAALNKLFYLAKPTGLQGGENKGDVFMVGRQDPGAGQSARLGLLASALSDLLLEKGKNPKASVDFWQNERTGTPGLKINYRF